MLKDSETRLRELESVISALASQDNATVRNKTVTVNKETVWLTSRLPVVSAATATGAWVRWTDSSGKLNGATSVILGGQASKAAAAGSSPRVLVRRSSGMIERQIAYLVDSAAAGSGTAITAEVPCVDSGFEYYVEAGLNALTIFVDGYR